jgi:hypothetical protein
MELKYGNNGGSKKRSITIIKNNKLDATITVC